jgi:hypothetical protein
MLSKYVQFLPEQEYRSLDAFSYSLLSALDESGPVALLDRPDKKSLAFDFGSYVDILLTDPDSKDKVFHTKAVIAPTAMLLTLADSLLLDNISMEKSYEELTEKDNVLNRIKSLNLWDSVVDPVKLEGKWNNDLFHTYLKESIEAKGKIILSPETLSNASHCVDVLLTHEYTKDLFVGNDDVEVLKQACILYSFKGVQGKGRLDLIRVNHKKKIIYPYDIKTGSELPTNFPVSFYKWKYYLQVISYMLAIQFITETVKEFKDYKIANFQFIYISKKLPDIPCIWTVPEALYNTFADGWTTYEGKQVKGFLELVDDYLFHKTNNIYNVERKVIEKKGNLVLSIL